MMVRALVFGVLALVAAPLVVPLPDMARYLKNKEW